MADGPCDLKGGEARTVVVVHDGETVQLDNGQEVRLIGALAPRGSDAAVGHDLWQPAQAAKSALEGLVLGKAVGIAQAGRTSDRYGRLLAHLFLREVGENGWVQGAMLKAGMARAYSLDGSTHCMDELLSHEQIARESMVGLWGEPIYQVKSTDDVDELLRARATFQIVEGRVIRATEVRGTLYVNFGEDTRQDFTIAARGQARRLMSSIGLDPTSLEGRRVRVRGWIERSGGPMIEIHHPHQIEILAEPLATEAPAAPTRKRTRGRPRSATTESEEAPKP